MHVSQVVSRSFLITRQRQQQQQQQQQLWQLDVGSDNCVGIH